MQFSIKNNCNREKLIKKLNKNWIRMAKELKARLDEILLQGKPQKEVIDKYRAILDEVIQTNPMELSAPLKVFISAG